jgi:hypothetical protein
MATVPTAPRLTYSAYEREVRLGGALVATAATRSMARRIAFALNQTRELYKSKKDKPHGK